MTNGLRITGGGALDFLSLGALVIRLDPGVVPFRQATECPGDTAMATLEEAGALARGGSSRIQR